MNKLHITCLVAILSGSLLAQAEVVPIAYWKLNGPDGAADGSAITRDAIAAESGPELLIRGNPVYSTDTPDPQLINGSLRFNDGDLLFLDEPITNATDLFGIELWVKSDEALSDVGAALIKNGSGQPGYGYGLHHTKENTYVGIFDGVGYIQSPDTVIPASGEWTHLALVRDAQGAGTQLYANGELIYASERNKPVPLAPDKGKGSFAIGGSQFANGKLKGRFVGKIALVRVFKFEAGEFKPEDLLYKK